MLWLQYAELVMLLLSAGILMWDNQAEREPRPLQVRMKARRNDQRSR